MHEPEPIPEGAGEPVNIAVESSVEDGVFQIRLTVAPDVELLARFNESGSDALPTLIAVMAQGWPEFLESVYEAVETQLEADPEDSEESRG